MKLSVNLLALCACAHSVAGGGGSVLIVGPDQDICVGPAVADDFGAAGYTVTSIADVAALDSLDLTGFDVVWMPDGIASSNAFCSGRETIPSPAASASLAQFVIDGGGLYLAGESGTSNQLDFLLWRDAFLNDQLGAGGVVGTCDCELGNVVFLDFSAAINSLVQPVSQFSTQSTFTGGFDSVGNAQPVGFSEDQSAGLPVVLAFDYGTLDLAPAGRVVVVNNTNNSFGFDEWALNALAFLSGSSPCPGDVTGDGMVDLADLNLVLANFGQPTDDGDTNADGLVDLSDLNAVLAAFGKPCS
ncbi:MAG: hypothetical protein NXI14_05695 [bacterium]|nr:hypothetical protein [bacterium]